MILPNTILAGAQKSGTTALCRFIDGHPHCRVSDPKEPNFFSRAANLSRLDDYSRCFRGATPEQRVLVDGTTTYMADPAIAPRIRQSLGDEAKIIFLLRAPSARAYSGFLHMLKRGHERRAAEEVFLELPDQPDAAAAAEADAVARSASRGRVVSRPYRCLYDDVLWNFRYVGNSLYGSLVESYFAAFKQENILVLFFEDIVRDVDGARRSLGAFLGVDQDLFPDTLPKGNQTRIPNVATPLGWLGEQARRIKRRDFTLVRPKEIMASPTSPSPAIREKLRRIFAKETEDWSRRMSRDLHAIGW